MRHAVITFAVLAMCLGTAWAGEPQRPPVVSPYDDGCVLSGNSVANADTPRDGSRSGITIDVHASSAPNAGGSWSGYATRALNALENNLSVIGNRLTDPTAYERAPAQVPGGEIAVTSFKSWRGVVEPPAPFANEHGNRMHFGLHAYGNGTAQFRLADLTFALHSTDPWDSLVFVGDFIGYNYNGTTRYGINWGANRVKGGGDDIVYTSGNGTTLVDEIVYVGVGNAWWPGYCAAPCNPADPPEGKQGAMDDYFAWLASVGPINVTCSYSILGNIGSDMVTIVPPPVNYTVSGWGPTQYPGPFPPPPGAPHTSYPGDTVEFQTYTGTLDLTPGTYVQKINTLLWTIDWTYNGTDCDLGNDSPGGGDWPDLQFPINAARTISFGTGPASSLSQTGLLKATWDNDYLTVHAGSTSTFFVPGYAITVTPGARPETGGSNFSGSPPWIQPPQNVMATFEVIEATAGELVLVPDKACYQNNDTVTVELWMYNVPQAIVGGQFFLAYNKAKLDFGSAAPGETPFTLEMYEVVDELTGRIDYSVNAPFGDPGVFGSKKMAVLTFTAIGAICAETDLITWFPQDPPTQLSDSQGQPVLPLLVAMDVVDNVPPVITCPGDITIECDDSIDPLNTGQPTATDNCDPAPVVTYSDGANLCGCGGYTGTITRTWKATDHCGNFSKCVQTITVVDTTKPTATQGTIDACYHTVTAANQAALDATTALHDNCDPSPTKAIQTSATVACDTSVVIRVTDSCGNFTDYTYNTRVDNTPPTATQGTIDACYHTVTAANQAALDATTALHDNCDPSPTKAIQTSATVACDTSIVVRVTDSCGNFTDFTYNTRVDNTPPVITCPPDVTVNADAGTCSATLPIGCLGDVTFNNPPDFYATHFANVYDLTAGDLILTYSVDLSGVTQTAPYETPYVEVGLREVGAADFNPGPFNTYQGGKGGWMTSLVGDLANPPNEPIFDLDDKHNLGASGGRGEGDYDVYASDPTMVVAPPFGSFNTQYIWFDRDNSDPWQDKKGANSGGTYDIRIQYHAITPGLGSMIATINGNGIDTVYQNFLVGGTYYPAGLSFKGDMTQMQVFAGAWWTSGAAGSVAVKNICVNRPLVSDNCDPNPVITWVRSDGKPLTDPYPSGTTTITWTATDDCGNSASCVQTVTVNAFNEMVVTVELSPTMVAGPITRCITFDLWKCPDTAPVATVSAELPFTNGLAANQVVLVPCADYTYTCITARDKLHTLRSTAVITDAGTYYTADFTGRRADELPIGGTGHRLVGGNLNGDKWIDILDFGVFSSKWATSYGTGNTTCSTAPPHADISGNGVVDIADFTFIQINFLKGHEANCCAQPGFRGDTGPVTRISVADLVAQGLGELAAGDINGDGWLDEDDMDLFGSNLPPAVLRGDANCDGVINFADINPFVQAVSSPAAWEQEYPNCNPLNGDINGDGFVDFQDINPFVALMTSGG